MLFRKEKLCDFNQLQQELECAFHIAHIDDLGRGVDIAAGDGQGAGRHARAGALDGAAVRAAKGQHLALGGNAGLLRGAQRM